MYNNIKIIIIILKTEKIIIIGKKSKNSKNKKKLFTIKNTPVNFNTLHVAK